MKALNGGEVALTWKRTTMIYNASHLDLTNCDSVVYEMKDGIPGMKFTAGGRDGWTPVRKRSLYALYT